MGHHRHIADRDVGAAQRVQRLADQHRIDPASVQLNGVPLDPTATYRVATNNFLADGGDAFTVLREGTNRVVGPNDLEALVKYVEGLPQPFNSTIQGRITKQ